MGADKKFEPSLFGGVEVSTRELEAPLLGSSSNAPQYYGWHEHTDRLYLYWSPLARWAVNLDYLNERFDIAAPINQDVIKASTHRVPLSLPYAHHIGLTPCLTTTYLD